MFCQTERVMEEDCFPRQLVKDNGLKQQLLVLDLTQKHHNSVTTEIKHITKP